MGQITGQSSHAVPSEELGSYVYINEQEPSCIPKNFNVTKNSLLRKMLAKDIVY